MVVSPETITREAHKQEGLGGTDIEDLASFTLGRAAFKRFLVHMYRTSHLPVEAVFSRAFFVSKGNHKTGLAGLRMIHLFCSWWRHFVRPALQDQLRSTKVQWEHRAYAYIKHRRREGAMIVQRAVEARLSDKRISTTILEEIHG